jgi:NitT/TauT family transport system ATP-binding protein
MDRPITSPAGIVPRADGALLGVEDVTLCYTTTDQIVTATWRVSFQIDAGDRFILLGPSGCGKSSLLKAVGGYMTPTEGRITLKGRQIGRPGPDRMMVFQEFDQLLPWKTVKQNIMFPMTASGKYTRAEAADRADLYIDKVNLSRARDSFPHTLSGGMKQRVAIARGMAMEPDILLMDEPFAALDSLTRGQMQDELMALWEDTKFTLLFVTHSINEALKIGSRILLLSAHPGRVRAELNELDGIRGDPVRTKAMEAQIYALLFDRPMSEAAE